MKYLIIKFYTAIALVSLSIAIELTNSTHFNCDTNKTHHIDNLNDNYCDCEDGSDENLTNACPNGIFTCSNYPYYSTDISTSKVSIY
jgi:protein kinase C substrate 80K-H